MVNLMVCSICEYNLVGIRGFDEPTFTQNVDFMLRIVTFLQFILKSIRYIHLFVKTNPLDTEQTLYMGVLHLTLALNMLGTVNSLKFRPTLDL